jgi:rod shape-determining protein MreB
MGLLTKRLSFEFCTTAIKIVKDGKLVLSERTLIAFDDNGKAIATGDSVDTKNHENVVVPIKGGIITDFNAFEMLLRSLIKKVLGKSGGGVFTPTLKTCCLIPDYSTEVEIRAVRDAMEHAGSREVFMVFSSHAIMESLRLQNADSLLLIDSGAGKISFSVLFDKWIHVPTKLDFGADKLKQLIYSHIHKKYGFSCNEDALSNILHNYMTFQGKPKTDSVRISGYGDNNQITSVEIDLKILNNLIIPYFKLVLNEIQLIKDSFKSIMKKPINQIMITGGLSKMNGFEKGIADSSGISITNKSDSSYSTQGLIKLDKDFEKYKNALR